MGPAGADPERGPGPAAVPRCMERASVRVVSRTAGHRPDQHCGRDPDWRAAPVLNRHVHLARSRISETPPPPLGRGAAAAALRSLPGNYPVSAVDYVLLHLGLLTRPAPGDLPS